MSSNAQDFPETVVFAKGLSMTFLRNEHFMSKSEISGDPDAETLYVPPHWHDTHDEILRVVKGKLEITLGSVARVYTPEDGEVLIRKGVVHSLRSLKGVACTFYERTDPMDDEKEIFFRNMFGNGKLATNLFAIALIAYQGDTIPALPGHFIWLEKFIIAFLGGFLAPLFGFKRIYASLKKTD